MVAVDYPNSSSFFSDFSITTSNGTPRQSSLRSITSTHSRRSLLKDELDEISDSSCSRRRVQFSCGIDDMDKTDSSCRDSVHEFVPVDSIEPLYLTAEEIFKIRSDARTEASHFAQIYPSIISEISDVFENGGKTLLNQSSQINRLRRRRRRFDPFDKAFESVDRDEQVLFDASHEYLADDDLNSLRDDDDNCNESSYFCTMRGLESRMSSVFRINRRLTIKNVINLQTEMKKSGYCPAQVQMGLRAVYAQASQKTRDFAIYQAALDEFEVYTTREGKNN